MGAVLLIHAGAALALPSEKIFFENDDNCLSLCTMNGDGTGVRSFPGGGFRADASPDGTKIAYVKGNFDGDIYVTKADGSGRTNLTNTPEVDEDEPTWSPDGGKLAYQRASFDSSGRRVWEIWTMNADGSGQARLTTGDPATYNGNADYSPDWSPDGSKIAFTRDETFFDSGSDQDIYTINPDGNGLTNLTNDSGNCASTCTTGFTQTYPDWSPDGSKIAFDGVYNGNQYPACLGFGIYTINANGSGTTRITNTANQDCDGPSQGDFNPQWSPGGGKIAFERWQDFGGPTDIWTANADGSGTTNLTNTPVVEDYMFDWGLYDPPDTTKPTISGTSPKPGSVTRDKTPTIGATVKDNITDLSRDNISLRVAGKQVTTFAYDPATDKLTYTPGRLTKGKKTVSIAATDAALNVGTKTWSFTVR